MDQKCLIRCVETNMYFVKFKQMEVFHNNTVCKYINAITTDNVKSATRFNTLSEAKDWINVLDGKRMCHRILGTTYTWEVVLVEPSMEVVGVVWSREE